MPDPTGIIDSISTQEPLVAAILILVAVFLWYFDRSLTKFIKFLEAERKSRDENTAKLTQSITLVHTDLREMDTFLRASIGAMQSRLGSDTQPLRRRKDDPK